MIPIIIGSSMVGCMVGLFVGGWASWQDFKCKAVKDGKAEYIANQITGKPEWRWKA
jgi:hypothetical protein